MTLEAQWHSVLGLLGFVLFVIAGFTLGGILTDDPALSGLFGGLRWLSFGLAALASLRSCRRLSVHCDARGQGRALPRPAEELRRIKGTMTG
jgi:hypothetical protein